MDINQQMLSGQNIYDQLYHVLMHQHITILQVPNCSYYWYDTDNIYATQQHFDFTWNELVSVASAQFLWQCKKHHNTS